MHWTGEMQLFETSVIYSWCCTHLLPTQSWKCWNSHKLSSSFSSLSKISNITLASSLVIWNSFSNISNAVHRGSRRPNPCLYLSNISSTSGLQQKILYKAYYQDFHNCVSYSWQCHAWWRYSSLVKYLVRNSYEIIV